LHWAAKRNHKQVVGYLLENGANKDIQAHDKSTAAYVCSDDSLRQILQSTTSDSKILSIQISKKLVLF
jgi:ankyrin repeat protein